MRRPKLVFFAACVVASSTPAWADSCVDPYLRTTVSPAKTTALQFTPKKRDCSVDYCDDDPKVTGELKGSREAPTLALYELRSGGKKHEQWSVLMQDGYEPMGMAVADDGKHAIIADRWCMSGLGKDAVILLGPNGARLQSWALSQLLPAVYIEALHHSSDNIQWRGAISYDPDSRGFNFDILVASGQGFGKRAQSLKFLLDPKDRSFSPRDTMAWGEALAHAKKIVGNRCDVRRWRMKRAEVPLTAPTTNDRETWLNYALELEKRIVFPKLETRWEQRLFLPSLGDPSYKADLTEFQRRLTLSREQRVTQDFYLVTPDLQNAHAVIKAFLAGEKNENLGNDRFVIVGDEPFASDVAATFAAYGAHEVKTVGLTEVVPPARAKKDFDWLGQRACAAIANEAR